MAKIRACRILIVEDDPAIQRLMLMHFRNSGYHVDYALSAEAVSVEEQYDVVVADFHLPGESGVELLLRLREIMPERPVVFMTGDDDESVARSALQYGAAGFLLKPFDISELDIVIRRALRSTSMVAA
jgi:two-component system, NtrC family, response regulator AtoC